MKKRLLLLSLLFLASGLTAQARETPPKQIKAEQIRSSDGQACYRCDYVLEDGWVTKVIDSSKNTNWKLKPKEALFILPLGLTPDSILQQVYRVSPDYGKADTTKADLK
jgi:hypothetical protein